MKTDEFLATVRHYFQTHPGSLPIRGAYERVGAGGTYWCCGVTAGYLQDTGRDRRGPVDDMLDHAAMRYGLPDDWVTGFIQGWDGKECRTWTEPKRQGYAAGADLWRELTGGDCDA